jgi:SWI/SNF-related matrix-associated actin-dependent regulator 1 of chromatin subfamily A
MNWKRELKEWNPLLRVVVYHGSQREREEMREDISDERDKINIFLTTYNLIEQKTDRRYLRKYKFEYFILGNPITSISLLVF